MYSDNTLTPKEATRVCLLGTLAAGPQRYSVLARAVRHFVGHILGPSLDLLAPSIELLRYEGLVRAEGSAAAGRAEEPRDPLLAITPSGREELAVLLAAPLRQGASELNKLVVALKFRFLHLLAPDARLAQADLLIEALAAERTRLAALAEEFAAEPGYLGLWLHHDVEQIDRRLAWLADFRAPLARAALTTLGAPD